MDTLELIKIELKVQKELISKITTISNNINGNKRKDDLKKLKELKELQDTLNLINNSINNSITKVMAVIESNSSLKMTLRHYLNQPNPNSTASKS